MLFHLIDNLLYKYSHNQLLLAIKLSTTNGHVKLIPPNLVIKPEILYENNQS